jgi:hypothetical protein
MLTRLLGVRSSGALALFMSLPRSGGGRGEPLPLQCPE